MSIPFTTESAWQSSKSAFASRVRASTISSPDAMGTAATSLILGVRQARVSLDIESRNTAQVSCSIHTMHLPPGTLQLLETYFAVVHPWFPIVDKNNVLRVSYLLVSPPTPMVTTSPGSGDHAILWAILSYTVTHSLTGPRDGNAEWLSLAKLYHGVSRNLIPSEKEHYEIGHVQALLQLTLVSMGLEDWMAAQLLIAQAARMAIGMGLGAPASTPRYNESEPKKTVLLACFLIDSLLSFRLSHIPSMSPIDLTVIGISEEDGSNFPSSCMDVPPFGRTECNVNPYRRSLLTSCCFDQLFKLALVLNKISREVWTGYQPADLAHQFLMELKWWEECVPHECTLIESECICPEHHMALLPYQSYVCLTHIATLLWLYLRLIPGEQGLHPLQRPAMDGALRLLSQSLAIISQQLEDFPFWDFPPMFEVVLRTIVEQALMLRHAVEPLNVFPFGWWLNEFRQKMVSISPTWPVYSSLASAMERFQHE